MVFRIGSFPSAQTPGRGLALLKLMALEKFDSELITYEVDEDYILDAELRRRTHLIKFSNPTMPQARRGLTFYVLQLTRLGAILYFSLKAIRIMSRRRPDVLHVHSPMHFLLIQWARLFRIETFLTFHGTDFVRITKSSIYRFLLKGIQNICCVSERNVVDARKMFPKACVSLVSNGVASEEFSLALDYNTDKTVLAVGTLRWHKGFDNLILMFSSIVRAHPEWVLKIIGDGPDKEKLQKLILSLGLQQNVFLLGAVNRERVACELARARIFALSSVTEGLPKVLLEAMCARSACVVFDVGDCARVIDKCGLVVESSDNESFIKAVTSLMSDSSLCGELGALAERRAKAFSWDKYVFLHETLYQDALFKRQQENRNTFL